MKIAFNGKIKKTQKVLINVRNEVKNKNNMIRLAVFVFSVAFTLLVFKISTKI